MICKPATFNPRSVDLFTKSFDHINKEMKRRGLSYHSYDSQEEKVARIIWKDAYDAGVNDACRGLVKNSFSAPKPTTEPETRDYSLTHNYYEKKYHISLTAEQKALLDWLIKNDFIVSDADFEEWDKDVIEVGRIK